MYVCLRPLLKCFLVNIMSKVSFRSRRCDLVDVEKQTVCFPLCAFLLTFPGYPPLICFIC